MSQSQKNYDLQRVREEDSLKNIVLTFKNHLCTIPEKNVLTINLLDGVLLRIKKNSQKYYYLSFFLLAVRYVFQTEQNVKNKIPEYTRAFIQVRVLYKCACATQLCTHINTYVCKKSSKKVLLFLFEKCKIINANITRVNNKGKNKMKIMVCL